jgi:hypothetical protein
MRTLGFSCTGGCSRQENVKTEMQKVKKKAVLLFMVKTEKMDIIFSKIGELENEPDSGG